VHFILIINRKHLQAMVKFFLLFYILYIFLYSISIYKIIIPAINFIIVGKIECNLIGKKKCHICYIIHILHVKN